MHVGLLHGLLVGHGGVVVVLERERVAPHCLHELILRMLLVLLVLMVLGVICHVGVWVVLDSIGWSLMWLLLLLLWLLMLWMRGIQSHGWMVSVVGSV